MGKHGKGAAQTKQAVKTLPLHGAARKSKAKKAKYRPQDPFFTRLEHVNELLNKAPAKDDDIIDKIPNMVGNMMPALDAEPVQGVSLASTASAGRERDTAGARKRERASKKNRRGGGGGKSGEDRSAPADKSVATDRNGVPLSAKLPTQKPGESAKDYNRRVDKAMREQLREARRKAPTDNQREKKRNRAEAKKKAREKKAAALRAEVDDGYKGRVERAAFGDVVKRPPILGDAAMKSRSKLKSLDASAGKASGGPSDIAAYAASVKEAYAAIKRRRLANVAQ